MECIWAVKMHRKVLAIWQEDTPKDCGKEDEQLSFHKSRGQTSKEQVSKTQSFDAKNC